MKKLVDPANCNTSQMIITPSDELSSSSPGVPNLSLTIYHFSIWTEDCTPKIYYDKMFYHD